MLEQIPADVGVEQIVVREGSIHGQGGRAQVTPGAIRTAIVQAEAQPDGSAFLPTHQQVAGGLALPWRDPDIGGRAGDSLEILQALLDIAQIENIAGRCRDGIP